MRKRNAGGNMTGLPLERLLNNPGGREREVVRSLAAKPSPALMHAYDVGEPIEYYADYVWHSLEKEKAFQIEERGRLGVLNCNTDVSYILGFGADDEAPAFEAVSEALVHNIDALIEDVRFRRIEYSWLRARVYFLPVASSGLLARVEMTNVGAFDKRLRVYSVFHRTPKRPRNRYQREYYHSYGLVRRTTYTSAGKLLKALQEEKEGSTFLHFDEHKPRTSTAIGKIVCGMMADARVDGFVRAGSLDSIGRREKLPKITGCFNEIELRAGETRAFRYAVGFQRYGAEEDSPYIPRIAEGEGMKRLGGLLRRLLGKDELEHVEKSVEVVSKYPAIDLPERKYVPATLNSLEMPRASTYNATGTMKRPFYNFCRMDSAELYDWWSYGQHAHESIGLINAAILDGNMAGELLLNHFDMQRPDGKVPYGVRQKGAMDLAEGTMPILGWIGWNIYLWSGDKRFLRRVLDGCSRYHEWWMKNRTDGKSILCNWLTPHETVRDIAAMPVWREVPMRDFLAPDVNACILREEELLAEMAVELGDEDTRRKFSTLASKRRKLMNELMWDDDDGCYYGIERGTHRKVRIKDIGSLMPLWSGAPSRDRADRMAGLIQDPREFDSEFPVTTLAKSDGSFGRNVAMKEREKWPNAQGAAPCMGDNWPELTYMIVEGLERYGMYGPAGDIAYRNMKMVFDDLILTSHFREHYDSMSGFGTGLYDYMWSSIASAFLIRFVYGIRPGKEGLTIRPELPEGWDHAEVRWLRLRGAAIDVKIERTKRGTRAEINGKRAGMKRSRELFVNWDNVEDGLSLRYEY